MNSVVDEILTNIDIVDVVWKYVPLKKSGSNFSGLCPFHWEKTPSFMVSPQKQIFKCFGCGAWWNAITFIKEIERIDFWDAIKILAKDSNLDITKYEKNYEKTIDNSECKEKVKYLHKLSLNFFLQSLEKNQKSKDYLKQQRHLGDDVIKKFQIWYAPDSNYEFINYLKDKKFTGEDIVSAGLCKQWQSWDYFSFFRNRIMFPIFDTMDNVIAFSWRIINPDDKPKYLNSPEHKAFEKSKVLYGLNIAKNYVKDFKKIIILEWQMDVIASYRLGFPIWVATCWTSLTKEHIRILKRYTDSVYFFFDQDNAWRDATIRWLKIAYQHGIFPKVIEMPQQYKDLDDLSNIDSGRDIFENAIDQAKDWFLVMYNVLTKEMDINSPIERQKILNIMFELIINLESPSGQTHYLNVLSDNFKQSYEVVYSQYKQFAKWDWKFIIKQIQKQESKSQMYQIQRDVIVTSLFRNNFVETLLPDDETISSIIKVLIFINQISPQNDMEIVFRQNLTQDEEEKIKEWQLWWEKEIQDISQQNQKIIRIKTTIAPSIKNLIKNLDKSINSEDRVRLLEMVRQIKW